MKRILVVSIVGLAHVLKILGSVVLLVIFIYGIYTLFASSFPQGLMLIGASFVGGWILQIIFLALMSIGTLIAVAGERNE